MRYTVNPIGRVESGAEGFFIRLDEAYCAGLQGLEGVGHIQVLWWCHHCDEEEHRAVVEVPAPYKQGPDIMGVFSTRSPARPNPIALSTTGVVELDVDKGLLSLDYIDAADGTPVLDIKPYTPSADRVEQPAVPAWCSHWPGSLEASEHFDWAAEFNF